MVDVPDPDPRDGDLLVDATRGRHLRDGPRDRAGEYGWAPPGRERLVLGHESLGRVREAPSDQGSRPGDLVVGVVRRPDPVPCGACAHGEFDMCRNGEYTERGIKQIDGYASEQWTVEADYAVRLDAALAEVGVLMEPTTRRGEGVGAGRADRPPRVVRAARRCWSPARDRSACSPRCSDSSAACDVHVLDQLTKGVEAPAGARDRRDLPPLRRRTP